MKLARLTAVVSFLAVVLTGCVSPKKEAEADKKVEYVYITPTGSNIPVRVRKDQANTSDDETAKDQDAMRDWQIKGRRGIPAGNN